MNIYSNFNIKNYLKFSSILVVGALRGEPKYGGKGLPPSVGWVFPVASTRSAVGYLQALGASCWLIFRSFLPLLASLGLSQCHFWHLLAPLSLSERIFVDFERYSEPQNSPGTSKINEKPLVFLGFWLFLHFAQDGRKSSKMLPESLQDSPKPL